MLGAGTTLPNPPDGCGRAGVEGLLGLLPIAPVCFGGAPKLSGSLKVVNGALVWLRCASYGSFFFTPATVFQLSLCTGLWDHPSFAAPLSLSMIVVSRSDDHSDIDEKMVIINRAGSSL